jgi:hypothetical protein
MSTERVRRGLSIPETQWKKPGMVRWYGPGLLAETGLYAGLSTMLGSMIDTRRFLQFEGSDDDCVIREYQGAEELWFDYAADIGDGWDATYTMAYLFSRPHLEAAPKETLARGRFLVLGGDEVYPRASKAAYAKRLVWPFNQAARNLGQMEPDGRTPNADHRRDIYCIPGNHDWYDGLAAFTRRFCNGRTIGSFRTRQKRSYFILKLPHDWELWGVDLQLNHDIDVAQLNFFRRQAETLEPGTRIILCLAEPDWVYGERSEEDLHWNIERFERMAEKSGSKIVLELAGDIHNYQRYEGTRKPGSGYASYPQTKVVSGGGGAFLHPTHSFSMEQELPQGFKCENRYPEAGTSLRLSLGNLFFALGNPGFSALLGAVYAALFWSVPISDFGWELPLTHPGAASLILVLSLALWRFSDFRTWWQNGLWGLVHTACHVSAAYLVWRWLHIALPGDLPWIVPRTAIFAAGGLVGGTVFGIYLLVSLNLFRIHENEAFSSLRIPHHKHFLRFHLTREGLRLFVVTADRTAPEDGEHPVPINIVERRRIGGA